MITLNYLIAIVITIVLSYLLGSISFSIIVTKNSKINADIRTMGSGNAGFTNVLRSVGKKQAVLTMIGDFLKCVVAILLSKLVFSLPILFENQSFEVIQYAAYLSGFCCFIGHIYPCFFNFRGGKGVLSASAIVLMTDWRVFIVVMSIFGICLFFSRIVSLSSILAAISYPISMFLITYFYDFVAISKVSLNYVIIVSCIALFVAILIVYSHRSNIKRLMKGTEKKITVKKN